MITLIHYIFKSHWFSPLHTCTFLYWQKSFAVRNFCYYQQFKLICLNTIRHIHLNIKTDKNWKNTSLNSSNDNYYYNFQNNKDDITYKLLTDIYFNIGDIHAYYMLMLSINVCVCVIKKRNLSLCKIYFYSII